MSKDTLVMLFPLVAMLFYVIVHFSLWRSQEDGKR
jgi:hypothetical protein